MSTEARRGWLPLVATALNRTSVIMLAVKELLELLEFVPKSSQLILKPLIIHLRVKKKATGPVLEVRYGYTTTFFFFPTS